MVLFSPASIGDLEAEMVGRNDLGNPVCGDLGRQMFFDYVGRYFVLTPEQAALPIGTACLICGATSVQLWMSRSQEASCIVQQTIGRNRAARQTAECPVVPDLNTSGKSRMGDGTMVIAGPHIAKIITKIQPSLPLPAKVKVIFSQQGAITAGVLSLLLNPPEPPFVAILFGKATKFSVRITVDTSRIFYNGPRDWTVDRFQIKRLLEIAQRTGTKEFFSLIALRHRLAGGKGVVGAVNQHERDQAAILTMRAGNLLSPAEFRLLPDPNSPDTALLQKLLSANR